MSKIYVIHENDDWLAPLAAALDAAKLPFESWHMGRGLVDLQSTPPQGVFFNRMSASSHTRDHAHAPELTAALLAWLERHGRRVINGSGALRLELSKVAQYEALESFGFYPPRTLAAYGREQIIKAAGSFKEAFIAKHNRSGKGLGVRLFTSVAALEAHLDSAEYVPPPDGILLLQEYIKSPQPYITRMEFVNGRFLYSVRVDTSEGFELCPADSCAVGDRCAFSSGLKFEIVREELTGLERYEALLKAHGVEVAGIEIIKDEAGFAYTYDINTNTNYNSAAEAAAGVSAMREVAAFLGRELSLLHT
jgi:glutathione synthase/RimK-type ligase-like ATP-grasp enzyme